MIRASVVFFIMLLSCEVVFAQKEVETREQAWFAYLNQTRLTKRSGVWVDLHYRMTGDFVDQSSVSIARLAYLYFITDQTRLAAGYAYVTNFSLTDAPDIPEHRPWQQIQWFDKKNGFSLMQYLRLEERYRQRVVAGELTNDYSFNWRFRYSFALTLPLKGKQVAARTPFLFLNDEVHVNAGRQIVNNYFDQNRFTVSLGYQVTPQLNAQLGYLHVFQQLPAANRFVNIHALRLFVFHNMDFRRAD